MAVIETYVTVDVDLDEFETDDLIEELKRRGKGSEVAAVSDATLVTSIYQKRRTGQDYQSELDELIYMTIGKIV